MSNYSYSVTYLAPFKSHHAYDAQFLHESPVPLQFDINELSQFYAVELRYKCDNTYESSAQLKNSVVATRPLFI